MSVVAARSLAERTGRRQDPVYAAVIHTQPTAGTASARWQRTLSLLAALAEENPGYLGYAVETGTDGEYAVTHWRHPRDIARWKKACRMVEGDRRLLDRMFGEESCLWPWMRETAVV